MYRYFCDTSLTKENCKTKDFPNKQNNILKQSQMVNNGNLKTSNSTERKILHHLHKPIGVLNTIQCVEMFEWQTKTYQRLRSC